MNWTLGTLTLAACMALGGCRTGEDAVANLGKALAIGELQIRKFSPAESTRHESFAQADPETPEEFPNGYDTYEPQ
jgi:hypothetical protein